MIRNRLPEVGVTLGDIATLLREFLTPSTPLINDNRDFDMI